MSNARRAVASLICIACILTACSPIRRQPPSQVLHVITTISTFTSFVRAVGGSFVEVITLVPVGVSPEDYQPTPTDVERLSEADVLVENGMNLEAWLARTIDNAKNRKLRIVTATDGLAKQGTNPHLWMDPLLAKGYVRAIRDALARRDPRHAAAYQANTVAYESRLDTLTHDIQARIATIPPESRTMIVFHNAWQYYNARFGLKTIGVLEISPGQEPNPHALAQLVAQAREHHVHAVFSEPEYSAKLARTLAESAGIATVTDLYDDSIGAAGPAHDYESMLRFDTAVIVRALGGRRVAGDPA